MSKQIRQMVKMLNILLWPLQKNHLIKILKLVNHKAKLKLHNPLKFKRIKPLLSLLQIILVVISLILIPLVKHQSPFKRLHKLILTQHSKHLKKVIQPLNLTLKKVKLTKIIRIKKLLTIIKGKRINEVNKRSKDPLVLLSM